MRPAAATTPSKPNAAATTSTQNGKGTPPPHAAGAQSTPPPPNASGRGGPATPTASSPSTNNNVLGSRPPVKVPMPSGSSVLVPPLVSPKAQVPTIATYAEGTYVFLPDEEEGYIACKVTKTFKQGEEGGEVVPMAGRQTAIPISKETSKLVYAMDVQSFESLDDMVNLRLLNDASILHNLRMRYYLDEIYTTIGNVLVSVNPFKMLEIYTPDVMESYFRGRSEVPHIFRLSDFAYRQMVETSKPQSCIVAGESGAGKTEATKLFLQYLAEVSSRESVKHGGVGGGDQASSVPGGPRSLLTTPTSSYASGSSDPNSSGVFGIASTNDDSTTSLQERILEANPLLEAFGNAKTVRNDNSSRFGKWIAVSFDTATGTINGGSITSYLLERTRVVNVADGERGYHIFYQLVAAAEKDKTMRSKYALTPDPLDFHYLSQSSCTTVEEINDARAWQSTMHALETVGIAHHKPDIVTTLAGILHLGNVQFAGEKARVVNADTSLSFAAQCFGFPLPDLERALISKDVSVRGEAIFKDLNVAQACGARDSLAKAIYGMLFDWLIAQVNVSLGSGMTTATSPPPAIASPVSPKGANNNPTSPTGGAKKMQLGSPPTKTTPPKPKNVVMGVLDIFGFESFEHNSFEQLCINFCNEKLQGHFNEQIFTLEQRVYQTEGLDVSKVAFNDNSALLALFERPGAGIFTHLDEEQKMPKPSDEGFLRRMYELASSPEGSAYLRKPDVQAIRAHPALATVFIVTHYAGVIEYDAAGFLEKNRDEIAPELEALLSNSDKFVGDLKDSADAALALASVTISNAPGSRKSVGMKGAGGASGPAAKKPTVSARFREQLSTLMETLQKTEPHFVRCIKPNPEKTPENFRAQTVLSQLKCSGLLEVCRIRQSGYPVQKSFPDFAFRYAPLCAPVQPKRGDHGAVLSILERNQIIPDKRSGEWQLGKTRIFMKTGLFNQLEHEREEKLKSQAAAMQKVARGFLARRRFRKFRSILAELNAAIKSKEESSLERAILSAGGLPYNGFHLQVVQAARTELARVKAQIRARDMVKQAMLERESGAIVGAVEACRNVGIDVRSDTVCLAAAELLRVLAEEREVKSLLRAATVARDRNAILAALGRAERMLGVTDSPEADEARKMKQRLDAVEQCAGNLEMLLSRNARAEDILRQVTMLIELGAKDHPLVARGEAAAKRAAEVSAQHAKAIADCKKRVREAWEKDDLGALVEGEREAQALGIARDEDVAAWLEKRPRLEAMRELTVKLDASIAAYQVKAEQSEGLVEADASAFETQVKEAQSKGLRPEDGALTRAKEYLKLMRAQIAAKRKLEEALALSKEGKDESGAAVRAAMNEAMRLGMRDEAARRGQNELRKKEITKEEKTTVRRRLSTMPVDGVLPGGLGMMGAGAGATSRGSITGVLGGRSVLGKATPEQRTKVMYDRVDAAIVSMSAGEGDALNKPFADAYQAAFSDAFQLEKYMRIRTDEDFTQFDDTAARKRKHARRKLKHSSKVISKSLTMLDDELNAEAIKIHKSILGWCGDQNAQFPPTLAQSVLKTGLERDGGAGGRGEDVIHEEIEEKDEERGSSPPGKSRNVLGGRNNNNNKPNPTSSGGMMVDYLNDAGIRDEIFLQLLKQVTENDDDVSEDRAWLLLCMACETFPPSLGFLPYMLNYLMKVSLRRDLVGNYARWCVFQLRATMRLGASAYMVDVKDINAYTTRPPVLLHIHTIYKTVQEHMTAVDVPVWPDRDVSAVEKILARIFKLPPETAAVSGIFLKDVELEVVIAHHQQQAIRRPPPPAPPGPGGISQSPIPPPSSRLSSVSTGPNSASVRRLKVTSAAAADVIREEDEGKHTSLASISSSSSTPSPKSLKKPKSPTKSFRLTSGASAALASFLSVGTRARSNSGSFSPSPQPPPLSPTNGLEAAMRMSAAGGAAVGLGGMMSSTTNPGRVPPPAFAPWPLPHNFYLGDVYQLLLAQERLPFLTYQRKIFLEDDDVQADMPLYIQLLQDIVNNRLPVGEEDAILELAVLALLRSAVARKLHPLPLLPQQLNDAGFFSYLPPSWLHQSVSYWLDSASRFLSPMGAGARLAKLGVTEQELITAYVDKCKSLPLFGAALFSVIRKDDPQDYVAAVNYRGLHLLTNAGNPVTIGVVPFEAMVKVGGSSTFVWISPSEEARAAMPHLFTPESHGIMYVYSQQAKECYQLLQAYVYYFAHGKLKEY